MFFPYSFHSKSTNKSTHMWLCRDSVIDHFDEAMLCSSFLHDLLFLEMVTDRMNQSNL